MEENHIDLMQQTVGGYTTIRIPESSLHRILIANFLAQFDDITPGHLTSFGTSDIINRYLVGPINVIQT